MKLVTTPLSGTNIRLLSGIPFNSDYQNTRWFTTRDEQTNWFFNRDVKYVKDSYNFQRIEGYSYIALNESIDDLWNINYLMFQNASYNNKWFYAFVTKLEYVQHKVTNIHFQIDVLQTWMFDITFKPSFVIREHCDLWNTDGSPIINTVDEGLHYGTEYDTISVQHYRPYADLYFLVVITKKPIHSEAVKDSAGFTCSVNGLPQALCYYVHPFYLNDGIGPASNLSLTAQVSAVILAMYESTDAVNNIVSMYVTEVLPDFPPYDANLQSITFDTNHYKQATIGTCHTIYVDGVIYTSDVFDLGNKYDGFTSVEESKLLMYPYTVTIVDDFRGNRIEVKNEYIDNQNLRLDVKGSLGTTNKVMYSIKDYLNGSITDDTIKSLVNGEHALVDNNPNDLPVLVDSLSAYLQGHKNSLANQKSQINFNAGMDTIKAFVGVVGNAGMAASNPAMSLMGAMGATEAGVNGIQNVGNAYYNTQALMAKQKDISNIPPQLVKMGANSYFDYGNGYTGVFIIKKQIKPEYRKKLSDFFHMFGYKKNELKIPNLHTRQSFNYVQTQNASIVGDLNNQDLMVIKQVFNNGVTLWHMDDVGNYGVSNGVI